LTFWSFSNFLCSFWLLTFWFLKFWPFPPKSPFNISTHTKMTCSVVIFLKIKKKEVTVIYPILEAQPYRKKLFFFFQKYLLTSLPKKIYFIFLQITFFRYRSSVNATLLKSLLDHIVSLIFNFKTKILLVK